MILSLLFTSLFGLSDEIHQFFVPLRSCDFYDWIADTIGAVSGFIVLKLFYTKP